MNPFYGIEVAQREPIKSSIYEDFNITEINPSLWGKLVPAEYQLNIQLIKVVSDEGNRVIKLIFPKGIANHVYGAANSTAIFSKQLYGYGTYRARLKAATSQPDNGAITGFFTFWNGTTENGRKSDENSNEILDISEIDFEFHSSCPSDIYMSIFTDYEKDRFSRVRRIINLSSGHILQTPSGMENTYALKELLPIPKTISKFDATKDYYIYGFTWAPTYIRFFIIDKNGEEIDLWRYDDKNHIPHHPGMIYLNVWQTKNWACINSAVKELKPLYSDAILCADWIEYEPLSL